MKRSGLTLIELLAALAILSTVVATASVITRSTNAAEVTEEARVAASFAAQIDVHALRDGPVTVEHDHLVIEVVGTPMTPVEESDAADVVLWRVSATATDPTSGKRRTVSLVRVAEASEDAS